MYGQKPVNPSIADVGKGVDLAFVGKADLVLQGPDTCRGAAWNEVKNRAEMVGGVAQPTKSYLNAMAAGESARNHDFVWDHLKTNHILPDYLWQETSIFAEHSTGLLIKTRPDW